LSGSHPIGVRTHLLEPFVSLGPAFWFVRYLTLPWDEDDVRFWRMVVRQMARWLPEEEAAQLCFDFEEEMRWLLAA
jgi:hypothetical protein